VVDLWSETEELTAEFAESAEVKTASDMKLILHSAISAISVVNFLASRLARLRFRGAAEHRIDADILG
jgi:hypothetical protein